ncbi:hypothetical protein HDU86_000090 [Geranomyces michiganensis]|nr:hypothetical protein HDU86_000090 [Geranomyces michiganensis]
MSAVSAQLACRLVDFITSGDSAPPTAAIAVFANFCKYKSFRSALKCIPHLNRFLRRLIDILSLDDIPSIVHSLRVLTQLVGTNNAVQALFSESNILEARKVMMAVLQNPDADREELAAVVDLLYIMRTEENLRKSFAADVTAFEVALTNLAAKAGFECQRKLFRIATILLKHGGTSAPHFVRSLIKLEVAQKAIKSLLSPVPRQSATSIDHADIIRAACDVTQAFLDMLLDDAVVQSHFDAIAEILIPLIPTLLNVLVDSLSVGAPACEGENGTRFSPNWHTSSALQPMVELALSLLRYKTFELDDRDLEGTDVQKMRAVTMHWLLEPGSGEETSVLLAAVYGTVADILSAGRQEISPLPSRPDDGPRIGRIMARATSPYVVHACIALLANTPPETWTLCGISMCQVAEDSSVQDSDHDDSLEEPEQTFTIPVPASIPKLPAVCPGPAGPSVETWPPTALVEDAPTLSVPLTPPPTEPPVEVISSSMKASDEFVPQTGSIGSARASIVAEMRRSAEIIEQQMAVYEQTIATLQRTIMDKEEELSQTASALTIAEDKLSEHKAIVEDMREITKLTTRELATTRDELAGATSQIAQLEADAAAAARVHRTKESASRNEIAKLSATVNDLQALHATLEQTTTTQMSTIAALREQLRDANIEQEERERAHDELLAHLSSALNSRQKARRGTGKGIVAVGGDSKILEDQEN